MILVVQEHILHSEHALFPYVLEHALVHRRPVALYFLVNLIFWRNFVRLRFDLPIFRRQFFVLDEAVVREAFVGLA